MFKFKNQIILSLTICFILLSSGVAMMKTSDVAVVNFTNNSGTYLSNIGQSAGEMLSTLLVSKEEFNVVERKKLKNLVTEQQFSTSGLVENETTAIQLGKMLGAEYVVTGSINNYEERQNNFKGYGIETNRVVITLDSSIKMINVTTGVIEVADLYSVSESYQGATKHSINSGSKARDLLRGVLRQFVADIEGPKDSSKEKIKQVTVEFTSKPSEASIEIDGIYVGSTPAKIPVKEGVHSVVISGGVYTSWDKKVESYEGLKVKANLSKE